MKPYHPNNIKLTGQSYWRMVLLAWAGKLLGIQFHVAGLPFGGSYRETIGRNPYSDMAVGSYSGPVDAGHP